MDERLEKIRKIIDERKQILYDSSDDVAMENFLIVEGVDALHEMLTGKKYFDYSEDAFTDRQALFCVKELMDKRNKPIREERLRVRSQALFSNPILSVASMEINKYCDSIKGDIILPKRDISAEEIRDIMTAFLSEENKEYKDFYKDMDKDGRVFLLNEGESIPMNCGRGVNVSNYDYYNVNDSIIISPVDNNLERLGVIAHELGHSIELMDIRNKCNHDQFFEFRLLSQYAEVFSSYYTLRCYDFLEKAGFSRDEIRKLRTKEILKTQVDVQDLLYEIALKESEEFVSPFNAKLLYTYGATLPIYFDNIENDEERRRIVDIYNKEKLNNQGLDIYNKVGCDHKVFKKSFKKHTDRCL